MKQSCGGDKANKVNTWALSEAFPTNFYQVGEEQKNKKSFLKKIGAANKVFRNYLYSWCKLKQERPGSPAESIGEALGTVRTFQKVVIIFWITVYKEKTNYFPATST